MIEEIKNACFEVSWPYRLSLLGMVLVVLIASIDSNIKPYLIKLLIDNVAGSNLQDLLSIVAIYASF